jgi:hypothetical protein
MVAIAAELDLLSVLFAVLGAVLAEAVAGGDGT